jgi:putative transposase
MERDSRLRETYLERIEHYRERYRSVVYAYVLMSNHVHLLIETGAVGLSKIMQGIQFSYTQRYNRRHRAGATCFRDGTRLFYAIAMRICGSWCAIFI